MNASNQYPSAENLRQMIEEMEQRYLNESYKQEITSGDLHSFNKIIYHLNQDFPDVDTSQLAELVNREYIAKSEEIVLLDIGTSRRRKFVKEQLQRELGRV